MINLYSIILYICKTRDRDGLPHPTIVYEYDESLMIQKLLTLTAYQMCYLNGKSSSFDPLFVTTFF